MKYVYFARLILQRLLQVPAIKKYRWYIVAAMVALMVVMQVLTGANTVDIIDGVINTVTSEVLLDNESKIELPVISTP